MGNGKFKSNKLSGRKKGSLFVKIAPMALAYHANGQGTCCLSAPDPRRARDLGRPAASSQARGARYTLHFAQSHSCSFARALRGCGVVDGSHSTGRRAVGAGPGRWASWRLRLSGDQPVQCQRLSLSNSSQALARTSKLLNPSLSNLRIPELV